MYSRLYAIGSNKPQGTPQGIEEEPVNNRYRNNQEGRKLVRKYFSDHFGILLKGLTLGKKIITIIIVTIRTGKKCNTFITYNLKSIQSLNELKSDVYLFYDNCKDYTDLKIILGRVLGGVF
jgi:hypothetical protein